MMTGHHRRIALVAISATVGLLVAPAARARTPAPIYSIAIGYNGLPPGADEELTPLRYADDDAAAFHQFASQVTRRSLLLTIPDRDTQTRFPALAVEARAPSLADLRRSMAELRASVDAAVALGEQPTVLIFYSGHGSKSADDQAALTLSDGLLTRDMLYEEILAPLHAHLIHLFVDACNAEAVVRPRDVQAKVVDASTVDISTAFRRTTLARFPGVGAVVASTAGAQAHEWDVYQSGIFTHEVLSALRGAADVDGNHRIEYSELAAFLGAANREVSDPRARPRTIVHPPAMDGRAPIVDLDGARGVAFLEGQPGVLGAFFVEDARGNRLLDLRAEATYRVSLAVPAGETLFLHNNRGSAVLRLSAGEKLALEHVQIAASDTRTRGALASSLRRGLFATSFGLGYYRGFVDHQDDLVAVEARDPDPSAKALETSPPTTPRRRRAAWISVAAATGLGLGAGVFGALSWKDRQDFENTYLERPAQEAQGRYQRDAAISVSSLLLGLAAGGLGAYLFNSD